MIDFAESTPEQTRPFRALRLWLPIKLLGMTPFIETLDEKLRLAEHLAHQLDLLGNKAEILLSNSGEATKGIIPPRWRLVVTSRPVLSILNFRLAPVLSTEEPPEEMAGSKRVCVCVCE